MTTPPPPPLKTPLPPPPQMSIPPPPLSNTNLPPPPPMSNIPPNNVPPPNNPPPPPRDITPSSSSSSLSSSSSISNSMPASPTMGNHTGEILVKPNHKNLVNNGSFADVQFLIAKRIIYSHSYLLQLRSPKLIEIKGTPIKKKKGLIVREMHKDTRENILLEVLGYIYTDEIDFAKLGVPDILQINAYAMEYDIPRLVWLCETHLREMLNTENVYEVLIEANKVNQPRVKDFCFYFIVYHYDSFIANKGKTSLLGIELFQDAIAVNQQKEIGTLKPLDLKPCPPSTFVNDLKKLYETKDGIEATVFRVGINGALNYVTAHRALLAGQTPLLHNLCSSPTAKGPPEHIPVPPLRTKSVYDNVSAEAFETLLKYVYFGFADIPPLHCCELIPFTIDYGMGELMTICYRKIEKSINEKTALPILGVTYIQQPETKEGAFLGLAVSVESTRKDSVDFILNHLATSDLTLLPRMFPKIAVDLVLANQKKERIAKGLPVEEAKDNNNNRGNATPNQTLSKKDDKKKREEGLVKSPSNPSLQEKDKKGKDDKKEKKDDKKDKGRKSKDPENK